MSEVQYASFDPETFVAGGGLLDDADVIVRNPRFASFTYPGTSSTTTALMTDLEDAEGKLHEQPYSVGDPQKFAASEDGQKVLLTGTATSINAKSNFAEFAKSLVNAGVPRTLLQQASVEGVKVLDGLRIHVVAQVQKDKSGNAIKNSKGYDRTLLLATKLIALPGEQPKANQAASKPAAGAPKATKTAAAAPAVASAPVSEELADKAVQYITQVAGEQGGSVARAKVSTLVFQAAMKTKDADKQRLTSLSFDEGFLTANSGRPVQSGDVMVAFEYDAATKVISKAA